MKIAFIGYNIEEKYTQGVSNDEDSELLFFLQQKGLEIDFAVWNDDTVNWEHYNIMLIKSPWDYHEKISLFYSWLEKIKSLGIRMHNPRHIIKWNSNKHLTCYIRRWSDDRCNDEINNHCMFTIFT